LLLSGNKKEKNMKLRTSVKLKCVAVLFVFAVALGTVARADGISDSNITTDGTSATVDAGQGETFTCQDQSNPFSCTDTDGFTCYGWGNCSALGATGGAPTLADFLDDYGYGPVQFIAGESSVSTPEPGTLLLVGASLTGLFVWRKRFLLSVNW
jgi:PEP-CTERM motif